MSSSYLPCVICLLCSITTPYWGSICKMEKMMPTTTSKIELTSSPGAPEQKMWILQIIGHSCDTMVKYLKHQPACNNLHNCKPLQLRIRYNLISGWLLVIHSGPVAPTLLNFKPSLAETKGHIICKLPEIGDNWQGRVISLSYAKLKVN